MKKTLDAISKTYSFIDNIISVKFIRNMLLLYVVFFVMMYLLNFRIIPPDLYGGIFISIFIAIIMAVSLNVATGFLGQLVLGHAGFMAIGAYTAAFVALYARDAVANNFLLFVIASLSAVVTAGIAGILVGTPALRLRGDYLGIMTLGFGEIVRVLLNNMKVTKGSLGLSVTPGIMSVPLAFWTTVVVVVFIYVFMKSRHGRAILSIREDEIAAESVGINITKYKIMGFVIASLFAGVGGSMYAFHVGYIVPTSFGFMKSIDIFVIVVLGGMGSITGAIFAAAFFTYIPLELQQFESYRLLIYSALLIIVMLYRPKGLMGTAEFSVDGTIKFFRYLPKNLYNGSKFLIEKVKSFEFPSFGKKKGSDQ